MLLLIMIYLIGFIVSGFVIRKLDKDGTNFFRQTQVFGSSRNADVVAVGICMYFWFIFIPLLLLIFSAHLLSRIFLAKD